MTTRARRRTDALSPERIVGAAVELLDSDGEPGLTFRALAERLATGPGALYWHVANKDELLGAATDAVVADALAGLAAAPSGSGASAADRIRAVALVLFDVIEAHPWLAAQLVREMSRSPWGPVTPRVFESLGRPVRALGVPQAHWFTVTSALVHHVLGAAGQNAANAASTAGVGPGVDRAGFLGAVATAWAQLDPDGYPFVRAMADQVRDHDDREQFLAGVDLVLTGIVARHPPGPAPAGVDQAPAPRAGRSR